MIRTSSSIGALFGGRTLSFSDLRSSRRRGARVSKDDPGKPDVMDARIPERKSDRLEAIRKLNEGK